MFSGLIEALGTVAAREAIPGGVRLIIDAPWRDLATGESVAVNGVCLTVVESVEASLAADIGPETLRVTTLGRLEPGSPVNLERALRAGDRVGGHFVQGHVDGLGRLLAVSPAADFTWMTFTYPADHAAWIIPKGAIAVDGISLTVATLTDDRFDVQIVPYTWTHTNLSRLQPGADVNLEFDMLGKYAVRAVRLTSDRSEAAPTLS